MAWRLCYVKGREHPRHVYDIAREGYSPEPPVGCFIPCALSRLTMFLLMKRSELDELGKIGGHHSILNSSH